MKWYNPILLSAALLFAMAGVVSAATEVLTFDSEELRERYTDLSFQLRCPKCQNQNVADSNAPISEDIRHKTYEMLHQGYSDQEIVDFMIDRYTEFVIYKPQMSVVTIWLWIVPGLVLVVGLFFLIRLTRKPVSVRVEDLSDEERAKLKALLEGKS
jgi:cytochrome c-type biogenesis protein CcmH